jgi:hypothetical protein
MAKSDWTCSVCGGPATRCVLRCKRCDNAYRSKLSADARRCQGCGKPRGDSNRSYKHVSVLCRECWVWTPERMAAAIRAWADEHGRPPASSEFKYRGRAVTLFGSWAAAVRAAGLEPYPQGFAVATSRRWASSSSHG